MITASERYTEMNQQLEAAKTNDGTGRYNVFVYGSLKRDFGNHHVIEDATFTSVARTMTDDWKMFSLGGFPGINRNGKDHIYGEWYKVTEEQLNRLHQLEGAPRMYRPEVIEINRAGGPNNWRSRKIKAIIYVYNRIAVDRERVVNGDWLLDNQNGGY